MVFSYLLRGIDLPTIFLMLGLGALNVLALVQVALFLACVPAGRVARIFLGLAGLFIVSTAAISTVSGSAVMLNEPSFGPFFMFYAGGSADWWQALAVTIASLLVAAAGLHVVSVAILKPPSANRMLSVRLYLTAVWVLGGALAFWWAAGGGDPDTMTAWAILSNLVFAGALLVAVSERDALGPRVRRHIPKSLPARTVAFLFFSGAAGGVAWALLVFWITVLCFCLAPLAGVAGLHQWDDTAEIAAGIALYALAYGLTAGLARRGLARMGVRIHHYHTWLLALALATFGSVVPLLIFLVLGYGSGRWSRLVLGDSPLTFLNPIYLDEASGRTARLIFVGVWALAAAAVSVPWFVRQVRGFRPLRTEPEPAPGGATHA
jgi:hypothetical protein